MILFQKSRKFYEHKYEKEEDLESEVVSNHKLFFGDNTIYIDAKRKISTKELGGSVPDGFLFDLSDMREPEFYIVEIELSSHDFFKHIFPQVTKFFAFYRNNKTQAELVEKIFGLVNSSPELKRRFKSHLGGREIYKFIKDAVENSQNILLVMDGNKPEIAEVTDTYSDTWGKMVRVITVVKFKNNGDHIYYLHPEFENIEYAFDKPDESEGDSPYTEEYHLDGVDDIVKEIYTRLKKNLLRTYKTLIFNPQKHYLSIKKDKNIAFLKMRKKKIRMVIMLPQREVSSEIRYHSVISLSRGIQTFYNGPCCAVDIEDTKHFKEIIDLVKLAIKSN